MRIDRIPGPRPLRLLRARFAARAKDSADEDPTCGLSAMSLAAAGNINDVWLKILKGVTTFDLILF